MTPGYVSAVGVERGGSSFLSALCQGLRFSMSRSPLPVLSVSTSLEAQATACGWSHGG